MTSFGDMFQNDNDDPPACRTLRRAGQDLVPRARRLAADPFPQVRREVALSLRDIPAEQTSGIVLELARRCDTRDKNSVETIRLGAANQEGIIWTAIEESLGHGKPAAWPDSFARLIWRLRGVASIDDLKARALERSLSIDQRKSAAESIGFIDDFCAAEVMLWSASNESPMKGEATTWLMRKLVGEWGKHGICQGMKQTGICDPEAIT